MLTLALVDDDLFLKHRAPHGHPEHQGRLIAARRGVESVQGRFVVDRLQPRDASFEELVTVHAAEHVARVASTAGKQGAFDPDTYFSADSYAAAVRAAGGLLAGVDRLATGADYALALVRPPGHHATASRAMGFCLFNSVAVAAGVSLERELRGRPVERVLVLDWDVHHGNGTQDIFYERRDVLYVSLHQSPQYPGTGAAHECGAGDGAGYTVNLPLAAGADDAVYEAAFERIVQPVIRQYQPDLVLVSAGYDAHVRDPLGGMAVTDAGFGAMTRRLLDALPDGGRGRTLFALEGGYDDEGLQGAVRATLEGLDIQGGAPGEASTDWSPSRATELELLVDRHSRHWDLSS